MNNDWIEIGDLQEIPQKGARVVRTGRGDIAVFRTADDRVFAVNDRCPHKGGPLSQGIVHDGTVTCPLHSWHIDLCTGQAKAPDVGATACYPVMVEAGRVFLGLKAAD